MKKIMEKVYIDKPVYYAEDGNKFTTARDCIEYESTLANKELYGKVNEMEIRNLRNVIPLSNDSTINGDSEFRWYELKSEEDYKKLDEAYGRQFHDPLLEYPTKVCVESCGLDDIYQNDAYLYPLEDCQYMTERFWNKLGYDVILEKK